MNLGELLGGEDGAEEDWGEVEYVYEDEGGVEEELSALLEAEGHAGQQPVAYTTASDGTDEPSGAENLGGQATATLKRSRLEDASDDEEDGGADERRGRFHSERAGGGATGGGEAGSGAGPPAQDKRRKTVPVAALVPGDGKGGTSPRWEWDGKGMGQGLKGKGLMMMKGKGLKGLKGKGLQGKGLQGKGLKGTGLKGKGGISIHTAHGGGFGNMSCGPHVDAAAGGVGTSTPTCSGSCSCRWELCRRVAARRAARWAARWAARERRPWAACLAAGQGRTHRRFTSSSSSTINNCC